MILEGTEWFIVPGGRVAHRAGERVLDTHVFTRCRNKHGGYNELVDIRMTKSADKGVKRCAQCDKEPLTQTWGGTKKGIGVGRGTDGVRIAVWNRPDCEAYKDLTTRELLEFIEELGRLAGRPVWAAMSRPKSG